MSSNVNGSARLRGRCQCGCLAWTSTQNPPATSACHCSTCVSNSQINEPLVFGRFQTTAVTITSHGPSSQNSRNDATHSVGGQSPGSSPSITSTSADTNEETWPGVTTKASRLGVRAFCAVCGALMSMRLLCRTDSVSLNMAWVVDESEREQWLTSFGERIFVPEEEMGKFEGKGVECYTGFDDGFQEVLTRWEREQAGG